MKLPVEFLEKMHMLLGEAEYNELLESYNQPRYYGLRVNTLKIGVDEFLKMAPFKLEPIPWTIDGFYYPEGENPGRHPYYYAGLYYIQEPSAMLPGHILGALPGEKVLDLCAAPGGKTVQIAAGMKGMGLLVANDISADRVKALVKNIELCGVRNAIVLNESPEKLAERFAGYFDRILIDVPCSGEGMFRKDEDAARSWESFKCGRCSEMQKVILKNVDSMLKPGGTLVYSTCTFSPEEDERMISYFLELHKDYDIVEIPKTAGIEDGRPGWSDGNRELLKTARLWPHRVKGEGHFAAMLKKGTSATSEIPSTGTKAETMERIRNLSPRLEPAKVMEPCFPSIEALPAAFGRFAEENLNIRPEGCFMIKGKNLYLLPESLPSLNGLKTAKFGWFLGEFANDRFEPSHSMASSLMKADFKKTCDFSSDSRDVYSYLKGETIILDGIKGYTAVCVDGYTLGWAKQTGDMLKNMYPKGWRKMN